MESCSALQTLQTEEIQSSFKWPSSWQSVGARSYEASSRKPPQLSPQCDGQLSQHAQYACFLSQRSELGRYDGALILPSN